MHKHKQHKEHVTSSSNSFQSCHRLKCHIKKPVKLLKTSLHDYTCLNKAIKHLGTKEVLCINNIVDLSIIKAFAISLQTNVIIIVIAIIAININIQTLIIIVTEKLSLHNQGICNYSETRQ